MSKQINSLKKIKDKNSKVIHSKLALTALKGGKLAYV